MKKSIKKLVAKSVKNVDAIKGGGNGKGTRVSGHTHYDRIEF